MPLKLIKRHGGSNWYIVGTERGLFVDESTKTGDKGTAEALLIKKRNEVLERSVFGARATVTFVQAAVSYMENGGDARFVKPLLDRFKGRKVATIGQVDVDEAARAIYPSASNATWNRQVYTPMSAILKKAATNKWCEYLVLQRPTQPKGRVRWITAIEARRLVDNAAPHLKPLLTFLLGTGARMSEALYLQWRNVDLVAKQVYFLDTKNGTSRGVPLSDAVVHELSALNHRVGPVFLTNKGLPYKANDDGGGQIKTGFKGACRRAGITDFTPHDCRHTFATWHYAKHRDIGELKELLGHQSVTMTMRYAHVNVAHLAQGVNAIGF